jgi:hypothetical protein
VFPIQPVGSLAGASVDAGLTGSVVGSAAGVAKSAIFSFLSLYLVHNVKIYIPFPFVKERPIYVPRIVDACAFEPTLFRKVGDNLLAVVGQCHSLVALSKFCVNLLVVLFFLFIFNHFSFLYAVNADAGLPSSAT